MPLPHEDENLAGWKYHSLEYDFLPLESRLRLFTRGLGKEEPGREREERSTSPVVLLRRRWLRNRRMMLAFVEL